MNRGFQDVQNLFKCCLGCRELLTDPGFLPSLITGCADLLDRFSTDQRAENGRFYYEMIVIVAVCDPVAGVLGIVEIVLRDWMLKVADLEVDFGYWIVKFLNGGCQTNLGSVMRVLERLKSRFGICFPRISDR